MAGTVTLPKGISQELYESAAIVIRSGFENKATPDIIKTTLIKEGIVPFNRLNSVYTLITVNENLAVNVKDLKVKIMNLVKIIEWTFEETYDDIMDICDKIVEKVEKSDARRCLSVVRAHFLASDKTFPKKPKHVTGRIGSINKAIIETFASDHQSTEEELAKALEKVCKTTEIAAKHAKQFHRVFYAVANSMSVSGMLAHFAKEKEEV